MASKITKQTDPARAYLMGQARPEQAPCPQAIDSRGAHQTFGGTVCARCGQEVAPAPAEALTDPQAFRDGEAAAYRRVLAFLDLVPEIESTRTRDRGRGTSHGVREIREAILTLAKDAGVSDL